MSRPVRFRRDGRRSTVPQITLQKVHRRAVERDRRAATLLDPDVAFTRHEAKRLREVFVEFHGDTAYWQERRRRELDAELQRLELERRAANLAAKAAS